MEMNRLDKIFKKHETDKLDLSYGKEYIKYLPKTVSNLLEIGTWKGGGIRSFREFYTGVGNFHTMNYRFGPEDLDVPTKESLEKEGFICHEGFQQDIEFLHSINTQFDVIIDDGSHHSNEQIISFKHLFKYNLISAGVYVCEDLHCCRQPYYWNEILTSFEDTILGVVFKVLSGGNWESQFFNKEESEYLLKNVSEIKLGGDRKESIVFITKK